MAFLQQLHSGLSMEKCSAVCQVLYSLLWMILPLYLILTCMCTHHFRAVTSHKRYGVWNHRQLECLFYSLFRLTPITSEFRITGLLWGMPPTTGGFLQKGSVTQRSQISQRHYDVPTSAEIGNRTMSYRNRTMSASMWTKHLQWNPVVPPSVRWASVRKSAGSRQGIPHWYTHRTVMGIICWTPTMVRWIGVRYPTQKPIRIFGI